jgi:putative ABC transport system ATP-binding protein
MPDAPFLLTLRDVHYRWPGRSAFGLMLTEFQMKEGETVLLLGESGSGKSTLLSLICGTVTAQSGTVQVAGTDMATLSAGQRDRVRAEKIGLIFQQFNLLPYAGVIDNILLPLRFAPERRQRVKDPQTEALTLCGALGLPSEVTSMRAGSLSVGQQQRVAAARAMIGAPPLLVADEPTSSLDAATQAAFLDLLFTQAHANRTTVLMVSHDARLADQFDRVVQMTDIATAQRAAA